MRFYALVKSTNLKQIDGKSSFSLRTFSTNFHENESNEVIKIVPRFIFQTATTKLRWISEMLGVKLNREKSIIKSGSKEIFLLFSQALSDQRHLDRL